MSNSYEERLYLTENKISKAYELKIFKIINQELDSFEKEVYAAFGGGCTLMLYQYNMDVDDVMASGCLSSDDPKLRKIFEKIALDPKMESVLNTIDVVSFIFGGVHTSVNPEIFKKNLLIFKKKIQYHLKKINIKEEEIKMNNKKFVISESLMEKSLEKEGFFLLNEEEVEESAAIYNFYKNNKGEFESSNVNESFLGTLMTVNIGTILAFLQTAPVLILALPFLLGLVFAGKDYKSLLSIMKDKRISKLGKFMYNISFLTREAKGENQDRIEKILKDPKIINLSINYIVDDLKDWKLEDIDSLLEAVIDEKEIKYFSLLPLKYKKKIIRHIIYSLSDSKKKEITDELVKFAASRSFINYTEDNPKMIYKDYIMSGKVLSTRFLIPRLSVTRKELMNPTQWKKFKEKSSENTNEFIDFLKKEIDTSFKYENIKGNFKKEIENQIQKIKKEGKNTDQELIRIISATNFLTSNVKASIVEEE
jgi:hypothetical protein